MKTMQKAASFLLLVMAGVALASMACTQDLKFSKAVPKTPEELLAELKTHQEKIDAATDATMKRIDEFNQTRKPGERTIHFSEIYGQEFTDAQRDVLNQMIAQEKDVSYKSLLEHIVADRNELQALQEKVMHLEQALPDKFVVVKKGDRHKDLAMNYLVNEMQLPPEKAKTLLAEADQTDELVPGNKVWFAYDPKDDAFRTYITRGEAKQLPLALRRANQRNLIGERDTARSERDVAQAEVSNLQQIKAGLETDISMLQANKASLEDSVARLSSDLSFRQNSLFYHAANERSLKDQGVLSPVLKRVKDVKPLQYEASLDLRSGTTINLEPRLFGLESIGRVRLLPPIFQEGRDFTVETSEATGTAKVTILDPELFKGKEVLVAVGG
jgi:predicted  nucleic acid-binding Zn-ribbon protein